MEFRTKDGATTAAVIARRDAQGPQIAGEIEIHVQGRDRVALLDAIRREFAKIQDAGLEFQEAVSLDGSAFVDWSKLCEERDGGNPRVKATDGEAWAEVADFAELFGEARAVGLDGRPRADAERSAMGRDVVRRGGDTHIYNATVYYGDHQDNRSYTTKVYNIQQHIQQTPPDPQATLQNIAALLQRQEASPAASQNLSAETQALETAIKNKPGLWKRVRDKFGDLHDAAKQVEEDVAPYARYVDVFGALVGGLIGGGG